MKNNFKYLFLAIAVAFAVVSCKHKDATIDPGSAKADVVLFNAAGKSVSALIAEYKQQFEDAAVDSSRLAHIIEEFLEIVANNDRFVGKKLCHIQPIYAYGIDGVAYYEIWFTADEKTIQGWALVSATAKDYPLVNYSHGIPYSSRLVANDAKDGKVYRFGVSYYALEKGGKKVADYGQFPKYVINSSVEHGENGLGDSKDPNSGLANGALDPQEGVDFFPVNDYEGLKTLFPKYYFTDQRKNTATQMESSFFSDHGTRAARTANAYQYRWVSGSFGYYTQIPANFGWNPYACWAGCNNNAWASLYAWWDGNMAKGALIPTTSTGEITPLYRNTTARQNSVDPVQMYCRSVCNTYCGDGTGWTKWSDSWRGYQYASSKGYGYSYQYQWCNSAGCNVALADIVTDGIANNYRPVHIGANSHFYVGYGWAQWDTNTDWTWAYCYPGWSENNSDDVWVSWHDFNASVKMLVY